MTKEQAMHHAAAYLLENSMPPALVFSYYHRMKNLGVPIPVDMLMTLIVDGYWVTP